MAYSQELAGRIFALLSDEPGLVEQKMFGGLAFMLNGNMCCGVVGDDLMARVGPEQYAAALELPHARVMSFTGRPMRNIIVVDSAGLAEDAELAAWLGRCLAFVHTLPPK